MSQALSEYLPEHFGENVFSLKVMKEVLAKILGLVPIRSSLIGMR